MVPSSLQKNIKELDRQISLLETECEQMEAEKRENGSPNTSIDRESHSKPYITGPSASSSCYFSKMFSVTPLQSKIYSVSSIPFKKLNDQDQTDVEKEKSITEETKASSDEISSQRPTSANKEVSKSKEDNIVVVMKDCSNTPSSQEPKREQTWSEILRESSGKSKSKNKNLNSEKNQPSFRSEPKLPSDENRNKSLVESVNENSLHKSEDPKKHLSKRRPRSARTQRNCGDEVSTNATVGTAVQEKQTQCALWNEEKENAEFLVNLNESMQTLQLLINELKTKSSKEKTNNVLNSMQNTLMKINKIKSVNTLHNPLPMLTSLKRSSLKLPEGEENILDLKKTLLGVKKFCENLSNERTALIEDVAAKKYVIDRFKSKEKEYLSVISSLKFNLEKMKEEAEQGINAKKEVKLLRAKVQEEAKVMEAVKKSHEKMQELVENFILENDKLKAQVKIALLESQKLSVLLSGKEVEINKYKKEIESFRKQITEQLNLLRSKAVESKIEETIQIINSQLRLELESNLSIATTSKEDSDEPSPLEPTETPSGSSYEEKTPEVDANDNKEVNEKKSSDVSETKLNPGQNPGLEGVLSSSKALRTNINELLEDMRKENSEEKWSNCTNSCESSLQSVLSLTSDEEGTEESLKSMKTLVPTIWKIFRRD